MSDARQRLQQRLQQQLADLQTEYDLWNEKLRRIRHSLAIEVDPSIKFKFMNDRQEAQNEWEQLAAELEQIEAQLPAAAELLRFCAFLAPDRIPEELLTKTRQNSVPSPSPR